MMFSSIPFVLTVVIVDSFPKPIEEMKDNVISNSLSTILVSLLVAIFAGMIIFSPIVLGVAIGNIDTNDSVSIFGYVLFTLVTLSTILIWLWAIKFDRIEIITLEMPITW